MNVLENDENAASGGYRGDVPEEEVERSFAALGWRKTTYEILIVETPNRQEVGSECKSFRLC